MKRNELIALFKTVHIDIDPACLTARKDGSFCLSEARNSGLLYRLTEEATASTFFRVMAGRFKAEGFTAIRLVGEEAQYKFQFRVVPNAETTDAKATEALNEILGDVAGEQAAAEDKPKVARRRKSKAEVEEQKRQQEAATAARHFRENPRMTDAVIPPGVIDTLLNLRHTGKVPMMDKALVLAAIPWEASDELSAVYHTIDKMDDETYTIAIEQVNQRFAELSEMKPEDMIVVPPEPEIEDVLDAATQDKPSEAPEPVSAAPTTPEPVQAPPAAPQAPKNASLADSRDSAVKENNRALPKALADRTILTELGKLSVNQAKHSLKPGVFAEMSTDERLQAGMAILIANAFAWDRQKIEDTFDLALAATHTR